MLPADGAPGQVRRIPLRGRIGRGKHALVDASDYERVRRHSWRLIADHNNEYALTDVRSAGGGRRWRTMAMHRLILRLDFGDSTIVDHINGNGLDNRRVNLRLASHSQNSRNARHVRGAVPFKGVYKRAGRANPYIATIALGPQRGRRRVTLGSFPTAVEAAIAYDRAAREHFGAYAATNASLGLLAEVPA